MVSPGDNDMPATGLRDLPEEAVIEFLGPVAGCGGVENVAGNKQQINIVLGDEADKPVKKRFKFIMAFFIVQ